MAASKQDIRDWFQRGVGGGATHMIIVCDTFDQEDYPVYVKPGEDPHEQAKDYRGEFSRVMEVYAMHLDMEAQLAEERAFHYEAPPVDNLPAAT